MKSVPYPSRHRAPFQLPAIAADQRHNAALARARREAEAATRAAGAGPMSPGQQRARDVAEAIRTGKPAPTLPQHGGRQVFAVMFRPLDPRAHRGDSLIR